MPDFFESPILNSPYEYPGRHWQLDADGQPTNEISESRRPSDHYSPVPKPKKRKQSADQSEMLLDSGAGISSIEQEYNPTWLINEIRKQVDTWRKLPNPEQWNVTPETERLLKHWRHHDFQGIRPFFCQIEAAETAIWLTEVAPKLGKKTRQFWEYIKGANEEAKDNNEAARLWINGIEAAKRNIGIKNVYDLSATPFFLRGRGYADYAFTSRCMKI